MKKSIKKSIKISLIVLLSLFAVVFANGCYYVFYGQEKSVVKLQQGKELNLYECCSIYTMHMAVWMFGWPIAPEAAQQAFLMTFHSKYRTISNSYFDTGDKNSLRYKLAFPDSLRIQKNEYKDMFYDLLGNPVYTTHRFKECIFDVSYSDIIYRVYNIEIQGRLLKYIQDKGWIHAFNITYLSWEK